MPGISYFKKHIFKQFRTKLLKKITISWSENDNLRMFAANEKVFTLFSNRSILIPKYKIRHMKTK